MYNIEGGGLLCGILVLTDYLTKNIGHLRPEEIQIQRSLTMQI